MSNVASIPPGVLCLISPKMYIKYSEKSQVGEFMEKNLRSSVLVLSHSVISPRP